MGNSWDVSREASTRLDRVSDRTGAAMAVLVEDQIVAQNMGF